MHTEDQAKQTWCPHVRVLEPSFFKRGPGTNGSLVGHEPASVNRNARCKDTNCIGSECSQWRWLYVDGHDGYDAGDIMVNSSEKPLGFCGLAGKP